MYFKQTSSVIFHLLPNLFSSHSRQDAIYGNIFTASKFGVKAGTRTKQPSNLANRFDCSSIGFCHPDDVQAAIERVTQKMVAQHSIAKGNHRRVPIEHITRTIIEGHMHHYTDRYNQTGNFRQFCESRGVSKNQIARWRPLIFEYLREELTAYAPV